MGRKPGLAIVSGRFFACKVVVTALLFVLSSPYAAESAEPAQDSRDQRIEELERTLEKLIEEIKAIKEEQSEEAGRRSKQEERIGQLTDRLEGLGSSALLDPDSWINKFRFGGYGEMHANFTEGKSGDQFDIHRLVLYIGYDFNEWIRFHSETEVEHAFVSDDSGGEVAIEQAYVDFLLSDSFNIRVGRILTPIGIVNKTHEPTTFNGVERPSFATYIIPTTWSSDGLGVFGSITPSLTYEAYVVGGLNGSEFSATKGIRDGRIKERPSLNEPAITGRLDCYPLAGSEMGSLRVGVSSYLGGLNNGNEGDDPDINADIFINSADFEYSVGRLDFRGVVAHEDISGAGELGGDIASEIFGWYLEGGFHFWPKKWKTGKLARSDAVAFVRYDDFDTQYEMPSGVEADPAGDRHEWTFGVSFYPVPAFVVKADYQVRKDEAEDDPANKFNLGVGWVF